MVDLKLRLRSKSLYDVGLGELNVCLAVVVDADVVECTIVLTATVLGARLIEAGKLHSGQRERKRKEGRQAGRPPFASVLTVIVKVLRRTADLEHYFHVVGGTSSADATVKIVLRGGR